VVWGREYKFLKKWSDRMLINVTVSVTDSGKIILILLQEIKNKNIRIYISRFKIVFQSLYLYFTEDYVRFSIGTQKTPN